MSVASTAFMRSELASLLASLRAETTAWIAEHTSGRTGQLFAPHFRQLHALRAWFEALHAALERRLVEARDGDELRRIRRAGLGLLGLWAPVRARLDHRDIADFQVWRCADAVSDSCYAPTFAALRRRCGPDRVPLRPYPLPFLSHVPAPYMLPAGYLPRDFAQALGPAGTREFAQRWPLPMVHLPITCKWDPWWMVMLGHEVGHQVELDLEIATPLAAALATAGQAPHWAAWSHEIFADAYAVLTLGRAATRALFELVNDDPTGLCQRHPDYPPALVRVALMQALADATGLLNAGAGVPEDFDPAGLAAKDPACARDLAAVPAIVTVLLRPLPGWPCALAELCAPDPEDAPVLQPRQVLAQQFAAYVALQSGAADDLPARRKALRDQTLTKIRPPGGVRSGAETVQPVDADLLVTALMTAQWSSS